MKASMGTASFLAASFSLGLGMIIGCAAPVSTEASEAQQTVQTEGGEKTGESAQANTLPGVPGTPKQGWCHNQQFPGQSCMYKRVCKYVHASPPFRVCTGSIVGTECEEYCDSECLYPCVLPDMPEDPILN